MSKSCSNVLDPLQNLAIVTYHVFISLCERVCSYLDKAGLEVTKTHLHDHSLMSRSSSTFLIRCKICIRFDKLWCSLSRQNFVCSLTICNYTVVKS